MSQESLTARIQAIIVACKTAGTFKNLAVSDRDKLVLLYNGSRERTVAMNNEQVNGGSLEEWKLWYLDDTSARMKRELDVAGAAFRLQIDTFRNGMGHNITHSDGVFKRVRAGYIIRRNRYDRTKLCKDYGITEEEYHWFNDQTPF